MRWFFRWLWRFNAILIAAAGLLSIAAIAFAFWASSSIGLDGWNPDRRVDANGRQAFSPNLELRFLSRVSSGSHLMGALVASGQTRYLWPSPIGAGNVTRNLVLFDRETGQGRRLFPNDEGEVGRFIGVDASCQNAREQNGMFVAEIMVVGVESAPQQQQADSTTIVALWGAPNEATWRLGFVNLADGEWREISEGITRLDALHPAPDSRCLAVVRKGDNVHTIEFSLTAEPNIRDVELVVP